MVDLWVGNYGDFPAGLCPGVEPTRYGVYVTYVDEMTVSLRAPYDSEHVMVAFAKRHTALHRELLTLQQTLVAMVPTKTSRTKRPFAGLGEDDDVIDAYLESRDAMIEERERTMRDAADALKNKS